MDARRDCPPVEPSPRTRRRTARPSTPIYSSHEHDLCLCRDTHPLHHLPPPYSIHHPPPPLRPLPPLPLPRRAALSPVLSPISAPHRAGRPAFLHPLPTSPSHPSARTIQTTYHPSNIQPLTATAAVGVTAVEGVGAVPTSHSKAFSSRRSCPIAMTCRHRSLWTAARGTTCPERRRHHARRHSSVRKASTSPKPAER